MLLRSVAIGGATDGRSAAAGPLATASWGLVVAALAIALVVPSPLGLTVLRLLLPATVPAAVIALSAGAAATWGVAAAALAALATVVAFSAETAEALVQGSAYGSEQRLPLRVPPAWYCTTPSCWPRR